MAGTVDNAGPSYISSHSADVILSDIRPIKLKIEALHAINVLLDEFLHSILSNACSLSTDKLRASLLSLLPTTLGKEALLEAEVELRAYWDRTAPGDVAVLEDDSKTFHLQWAFELLRLKCEAYSTLNESDEDRGAEGRINERMGATGDTPPKATLMAPAALYLTAILEAVCEHILSNVGRVAARDSSRTTATVQDLFVALCEDHSIYDLFRTMKVYDQVEQLSKAPKVRRSKSFTRNDKSSRTSSPHQDLSTAKDASVRSRLSSEASGLATNVAPGHVANSGSRSSFEKSRAMKMFKVNSRSSIDRDADVQNGHQRTGSAVSEGSRHTASQLNDEKTYEDEAMQQEFEDLMRSSSTMKVSLTPDRLKTMEVYKQEKDQRGNRRPAPPSFKPETDLPTVPPRATGRRPSLLRVDSIKEDEEEGTATKPFPTRNRQASVSTPPAPKTNPSRARSISTTSSNTASRAFAKLSQSSIPPVSMQPKVMASASMQHHRYVGKEQDGFPPRTRKIQHNRESMDLDDIMAGSDDEDIPVPKTPSKTSTPQRIGQHAVSASTRDLMDFLAQGPPPDVAEPTPDFNTSASYNGSSENGKSKGTGRLQRMISKLSLSNAERSREDSQKLKSPQSVARPTIPAKPSLNGLSSLANRPIPPRPPRPISPPPSSHASSDEQHRDGSRSRSASVSQSSRRPSYLEAQHAEPVPVLPAHRDYSETVPPNRREPSSHANGHGQTQRNGVVENMSPVSGPPRTFSPQSRADSYPSSAEVEKPKHQSRSHVTSPTSPVRKPPPVYADSSSKLHLSSTDAKDMHRLFARATTADECRLIFDMFLAKSGIPVKATNCDAPYPSPSPSVVAREQTAAVEAALEHTLVELLLGADSASASNSHRRRAKKQLEPEVVAAERMPRRVAEDAQEGSSVGKRELHSPRADINGTQAATAIPEYTPSYTPLES
ncbi:hypothetical protein LshimejAT787_0109940 [Lyophyllum shimeji]|uniref:Uncharacterized protein n=1 Tax=Lyophyllum shimeji TaxID=47721 RepID=A0A9P3PDS8_LYOSH|nr:hypothetical protein LshimejAT787_0109940 [Lyophyllum shimeji]